MDLCNSLSTAYKTSLALHSLQDEDDSDVNYCRDLLYSVVLAAGQVMALSHAHVAVTSVRTCTTAHKARLMSLTLTNLHCRILHNALHETSNSICRKVTSDKVADLTLQLVSAGCSRRCRGGLSSVCACTLSAHAASHRVSSTCYKCGEIRACTLYKPRLPLGSAIAHIQHAVQHLTSCYVFCMRSSTTGLFACFHQDPLQLYNDKHSPSD
jgi:hypothetical protein